jgi:uncharacterized membrane protein YeaQ/YmgE (transglycosylase-associated protein family)
VSVLVWVALGLVGGAVAGWLLPAVGSAPAGAVSRGRAVVSDAVVGVLGAVLGGFMAAVLLGLDIADTDGTSVLVAALGAALLILILHALPVTDVFE